MTDKFRNKYRISSARLQNWDYGWNAAYFITICTKNRVHYFGEVISKTMELNDIGLLAKQYWLEIPQHFPFVELGNFIVMPNHVHGILIIDKNETNELSADALQCNASTTKTNKNEQMAKISPKPGTISTIIRSYKSVVSNNAHLTNHDFQWQSRFHDHVIWDSQSFKRIQNYIEKYPFNWNEE
jgi:putative transposase